jgi:D-amino peptidase
MKILIAVDMEGITGVTHWDQVTPGHFEYPRFRKLMTEDVNAAIRGAFEGGASEIVVTDGHAGGNNILIEELNPRACLNAGNDSPFSMVQGIAAGDFNGVIFVGYHARSGSPNGVLAHTWSSKRVANVWLNNVIVGEYGLNAALCGAFGAPVLMITGDQTACAQAVALLGPLETVEVKQATSFQSAECLPPAVTQEMIRAAAQRAVSRLSEGKALKPFVVAEPVVVRIEFRQVEMADSACTLPGARRLNGTQVEFTSPDMPAAYQGFQAAVGLA